MKRKESIIHLAQYYETDQMKVIHHSNYIKWMEEARDNFLKNIGIDFEENINIVVLFESVKYIKSIKYNERIKVTCQCNKLANARFDFLYEFYNENNCLCAIGKTEHCLVNDKLEPIVFKKNFPKQYNILLKNLILED